MMAGRAPRPANFDSAAGAIRIYRDLLEADDGRFRCSGRLEHDSHPAALPSGLFASGATGRNEMAKRQAWLTLGFSPLLVATVALTAAQLWPFAIITAAAAVVTMLWSRVVARRELGDEALRAEEEWKAAHGNGPR